jgi:hypothetical protein
MGHEAVIPPGRRSHFVLFFLPHNQIRLIISAGICGCEVQMYRREALVNLAVPLAFRQQFQRLAAGRLPCPFKLRIAGFSGNPLAPDVTAANFSAPGKAYALKQAHDSLAFPHRNELGALLL